MEEMKVNVEEIMTEIRKKIRDEGKVDMDLVIKEIEEEGSRHPDIPVPSFTDEIVASSSSSKPFAGSIIQQNINETSYLKSKYRISYFRELGNGSKGFIKRVVRKFIKSIVLPMREEQDDYNLHVANGVDGLRIATEQLSEEITLHRHSLDQLSVKMMEQQHSQEQLSVEMMEQQHSQEQLSVKMMEQQHSLEQLSVKMMEQQHSQEQLSVKMMEQQHSQDLLSKEMKDLTHSLDLLSEKTSDYHWQLEQHASDLKGHGDELAAHRNKLSSLNDQVVMILKKLEDQEQCQKRTEKATDDISMTVARVIQHYMEPENRKIPATLSAESDTSNEDNPSDDRYHAIDYFRFENDFRGSQNEIMERQKIYLPYFRNKTGRIFDLGCGRGEFLRLLKEEKIPSFGVDMYSEYTITGKLYDIDIQQGDGIDLLDKTNENFGGIFCAQVIEHIGFQNIQKLCKLAYERLEDDAWLVLETPNPMCVSAMTNAFYIDPTHEKPVHPLMMEYLLKSIGFREVQLLWPDHSLERLPHIESDEIKNIDRVNLAIDRLSDMLFGSQDYAVIGKK